MQNTFELCSKKLSLLSKTKEFFETKYFGRKVSCCFSVLLNCRFRLTSVASIYSRIFLNFNLSQGYLFSSICNDVNVVKYIKYIRETT